MTRNFLSSQTKLARPSYETGLTRTHGFLVQIADELSESLEDVTLTNEESSISDWRRVERRHLEDAACEVITVVRKLPLPIRQVVERRAAGMSWAAICLELPNRAPFSIKDDWNYAISHLTRMHQPLLDRFI